MAMIALIGVNAAAQSRGAVQSEAAPKFVIQSVTGQVELKAGPGLPWQNAFAGMALNDGMIISTGFLSQVILLIDGKQVTVPSLTRSNVVFSRARNGKTGAAVWLPDSKYKSTESFLPAPPIGFGRGERVKVRLPQGTPFAGKNNENDLDSAGFKQSPSTPRNVTITIEIIWP